MIRKTIKRNYIVYSLLILSSAVVLTGCFKKENNTNQTANTEINVIDKKGKQVQGNGELAVKDDNQKKDNKEKDNKEKETKKDNKKEENTKKIEETNNQTQSVNTIEDAKQELKNTFLKKKTVENATLLLLNKHLFTKPEDKKLIQEAEKIIKNKYIKEINNLIAQIKKDRILPSKIKNNLINSLKKETQKVIKEGKVEQLEGIFNDYKQAYLINKSTLQNKKKVIQDIKTKITKKTSENIDKVIEERFKLLNVESKNNVDKQLYNTILNKQKQLVLNYLKFIEKIKAKHYITNNDIKKIVSLVKHNPKIVKFKEVIIFNRIRHFPYVVYKGKAFDYNTILISYKLNQLLKKYFNYEIKKFPFIKDIQTNLYIIDLTYILFTRDIQDNATIDNNHNIINDILLYILIKEKPEIIAYLIEKNKSKNPNTILNELYNIANGTLINADTTEEEISSVMQNLQMNF